MTDHCPRCGSIISNVRCTASCIGKLAPSIERSSEIMANWANRQMKREPEPNFTTELLDPCNHPD